MLRQLAITFCVLCLLTAGMDLLSEGLKTRRMLRFLCALVFLLTMLSCLPSLSVTTSLPTEAIGQVDTRPSERVAEILIGSVLEQNGISYRKITAKATKNEDGSIRLSKVTVFTGASLEQVTAVIRQTAEADEVEVVNES